MRREEEVYLQCRISLRYRPRYARPSLSVSATQYGDSWLLIVSSGQSRLPQCGELVTKPSITVPWEHQEKPRYGRDGKSWTGGGNYIAITVTLIINSLSLSEMIIVRCDPGYCNKIFDNLALGFIGFHPGCVGQL